jgi:hypothetical protein
MGNIESTNPIRKVLPAAVLGGIAAIATFAVFDNNVNSHGANIHHQMTPHRIHDSRSSLASEAGGVEAPPSLSKVFDRHVTLTPIESAVTGGVTAP